MSDTPTVAEATAVIIDTEVAALNKIQAALVELEEVFAEVQPTLSTGITLDASRIINEIRGAVSYKRTSELPMLLARYAPQPAMPAMDLVPPFTGGTTNG